MSRFIVAFRCSFLQLVRNVQGNGLPPGHAAFHHSDSRIGVRLDSRRRSYLKGVDTSTFFAVGMMIFFQLFGGSYSMTSVKAMFLSPRRWRIRALPCRPTPILLGILGASTLISLAQGFLLVAFSRVFLGARFGNAGNHPRGAPGYRPALTADLGHAPSPGPQRHGGIRSGVDRQLRERRPRRHHLSSPEGHPFFRFTATYGTPFSLAQTALLDASRGGPAGEIALCIGILFLAAAMCACLTALLGRRKLA